MSPSLPIVPTTLPATSIVCSPVSLCSSLSVIGPSTPLFLRAAKYSSREAAPASAGRSEAGCEK